MLLSICIPTYNRSEKLDNCLNSILISIQNTKERNFEICISDNCSSDNTEKIVKKYKNLFEINYHKNNDNLGFAFNAKKVVRMAKGKFTWLIGDDDLILPNTIKVLMEILRNNENIEFFFVNSYYLNSKYLEKFPKPFDTNNIKFSNLKALSEIKENKIVNFWDLIDPKISWEFLIGIFLIVFKTSNWLEASEKVDNNKLKDKNIWSSFENTCFFPIVNAYAFKNSKALICSNPLSVNIIGYREWKSYYELVEVVRLPELLDFYRKEGLPLKKYLSCKNFSLRNFSNYLFKIIINSNSKGREYIDFKNHILKNLFFPNFNFSIIFFLFKKISLFFKALFR